MENSNLNAMVDKPAENRKWFFNYWVIAASILSFGPLGLLLVWYRPRTKTYIRILITAGVLFLTIWMTNELVNAAGSLIDYYKELGELVK